MMSAFLVSLFFLHRSLALFLLIVLARDHLVDEEMRQGEAAGLKVDSPKREEEEVTSLNDALHGMPAACKETLFLYQWSL